jgi:hypothetical protein
MALRSAAVACILGVVALLAATNTLAADMPSPTARPRPDCATLAPASEAYRDCVAGRMPGDPSGRRGTSPDTLGVSPNQPGTTTVPGGTPTGPGTSGMVPGTPANPTGTPGTTPTMPGTTTPGTPSGGTAGPGR